MKAVLQRVLNAKVMVEDSYVCGEIEQGLLILLGVINGDHAEECEILAKKIVTMRIFSDHNGKMNHSILDVKGNILLIPNFTLGADCSHGRRPYFSCSAPPEQAKPLFLRLASCLEQELGHAVQCGVFGAHMQIEATFSGPVTICLDTQQLKKTKISLHSKNQ